MPSGTGSPHRRPATTEEIRALASGVRLRILRLTLHRPLTNREIAEALALNPATVLYHVRRLVDVGLLERRPAQPRPGGGVEIPYVSRGGSWALQIEEGRLNSAVLDAFLHELRQVGVDKLYGGIRFHATLTPARRKEMLDRITAVLDEYQDDRTGEPWALFFAMHPSSVRALRGGGAPDGG
jgi:DNA-binding transcriptional ArsR family regulator